MRKVWWMVMVALLVIPYQAQAGSFGKDDPSGNPGEWYLGDVPTTVADEKYPILFVHGLNSSSATWWNENDMYNTAFTNGYKTAFIDLYPTKNMWDNGELLAQKINDIYHHFGEKVVVVAHSKGGIDTQSALVHYGAYPYVENLITLSSPHYGSQLADLAYSSWAGWLADILGSKNDATYSLQTGYMNYFRELTDDHTNVRKNDIYTLGGTSWGSFGSSLYWGGLYLRQFGSNDGAVTVQNSRLPYAQEISVGNWNHYAIKEGNKTFRLFAPYLTESGQIQKEMISNQYEQEPHAASSFIRGGEFKGIQSESFYVEEGVTEIQMDWMSDQLLDSIVLVGPSNKHHQFKRTHGQSEFFPGSEQHTLSVKDPAPGKWTIISSNSSENHYLVNVSFESPLNEQVKLGLSSKKDAVEVKKTGTQIKDFKTTTMIHYYKNGRAKEKKIKVSHKGKLKLPQLGEGIYNITTDIKGETNKGNRFERTIVESIYVDGKGNAY
ncbi:esterase/lipase family protein [Rossellomorea sp. BNER]|uniref:esterase/lipase family protein n=1 Tax=Rossellomorea sp. BNER TaxID=2962031 RepID=UPI003AF2B4DE|nr:hypothetical protein [Rossellomorea sp. BNER]